MPSECAAVGCSELAKKGCGLSFHLFPKDKDLQKRWLVNMNRRESQTSQKLWQPKPHDKLCSKHFEKSCFTNTTNLSAEFDIPMLPRLKPDAVPTIFEHRKRPQSTHRSATSKRQRREIVSELLGKPTCSTETQGDTHGVGDRDSDAEIEEPTQPEPSAPTPVIQTAPLTSTVKVQTVRVVSKCIIHRFDIWHMAKGVGKKVDLAAKSKANESLAVWAKSLKNHLYWCSVSSPEGPDRAEVVRQKWTSISNHVANIHEGHGDKFPKCAHGALAPRTWIEKDSRQHRILNKIVQNPFLLRDIGMLSPDVQTSALESYHAVVCHFAPKLNHFTNPVMQAKLYLAAIHFNANADRKQASTADGELRWKVDRPRATKGVPVTKLVKEAVTTDYIHDLYQEVLLLREAHPSYSQAKSAQQRYLQTVPESLSKTAGDIDKKAVIAQHRSRFAV